MTPPIPSRDEREASERITGMPRRALTLLALACCLVWAPHATADGVVGGARVAAGGGSGVVWSGDPASSTVRRLDPATGRPASPPLPAVVEDLALYDGSVWAAGGGVLERRDWTTGAPIGPPLRVGDPPTALATGLGRVWVIDRRGRRVSQISPRTGRSAGRSFILGPRLWAGTTAFASLWVSRLGYLTPREQRQGGPGRDGRVLRISPTTRQVRSIRVGHGPLDLVAAGGGLWVAEADDGTIARIDPAANRVTRRVRVGGTPTTLTANARWLWVATGTRILKIDPRTGATQQTTRLPGRVVDLAVGAGGLWAGVEGRPRPVHLDAH